MPFILTDFNLTQHNISKPEHTIPYIRNRFKADAKHIVVTNFEV